MKRRFLAWGVPAAAALVCAPAFGSGWLREQATGVGSDIGRELGLADPTRRYIIDDAAPDIPQIRTVQWAIGPGGVALGADGNSAAIPAASQVAIQNAFNSIQNATNRLIFNQQPSANAAFNDPANAANSGTMIDVWFATLAAGELGVARFSRANTTNVNPGPYGDDTKVVNKIDIILNSTLAVWDPTRVVNGYQPVVNPLVQPYGTYTGGQAAGIDDVEGTVIHEVMHCLGLQHPDRTIQNYSTAARFTRNYDTTLGPGPNFDVNAALSWVLNEDDFRLSGKIRTQGGAPAVGGGFTVYPSAASSALMNSESSSSFSIVRRMTPDDMKGLAYEYNDFIAHQNAVALQTQTALRYTQPGVKVEVDHSKDANERPNNDPSQATRNDLPANAMDLGLVDVNGPMLHVVGSIAGRADTGGLDTDYYRFSALAGSTITFDLDEGHNVGDSMDAFIRLFKDDGVPTPISAVISNDTILNGLTMQGSLSALDPAFNIVLPGDNVESYLIQVGTEGAAGLMEGDYDLTILIPEPASAMVIAIGAVMLSQRRRRVH